MGLIAGIVLIALGLLAASSAIVARRPDAQAMIDMLVPYQGWLGFIACLWGLWVVIQMILNIGLLSIVPILWITILATGAILFVLGLLLGYALLTKFILSRNAEATRRGEQVRLKLVPYQVTLGYIGIVLGAWGVIDNVLHIA